MRTPRAISKAWQGDLPLASSDPTEGPDCKRPETLLGTVFRNLKNSSVSREKELSRKLHKIQTGMLYDRIQQSACQG